MVQSLEVMSGEHSGGMDVSLDVSTSAQGAPSTSRSRNFRLLLVAAPFCLVAFGYIGLQGLRSNDASKHASKHASNDANGDLPSSALQGKQIGLFHKGLDIEGLTAYQTLTGRGGQKCGWPTEIHLKNTYFSGTDQNGQAGDEWQVTALYAEDSSSKYFAQQRKRDMIAKYPEYREGAREKDTGFYSLVFQEASDFHSFVVPRRGPAYRLDPNWTRRECWPRAIPGPHGSLEEEDLKLEDLKRDGVNRVQFSKQAMDILLGSVRGRPAVAAGTWSRQVGSVFGAFFGGGEAYNKKKHRQGAGGWLAKDLLERRVLARKEPLVLQEGLQKVVAKMQGSERSRFVEKLALDDEVKSAYRVIASLFFFVKRLSEADITTVLEVDEFFSVEELPVLLAGLQGDSKSDTFTNILHKSAEAVKKNEDAAADAEARRSGHRFLLRCWLLLERYEASKPPGEVSEVAEITAGAAYLRSNLRKFLNDSDDLPKFLQESRLKISRRGPPRSAFRRTISDHAFIPIAAGRKINLYRFPLYLALRVKEELGAA